MLLAVDCIIFGFDGTHLKLLLIKRGFEPQKGRWSLMGGFVTPEENLEPGCCPHPETINRVNRYLP
jgi:ADP-ribose pyrophosphatase YjhB (NUDIX family)